MADRARPTGRCRTIARVMRLDETDEPEREPTCGCRYDLEGDTVQLAGLGPGGVWRGETAVQFEFDRVYGPGSKRRDIHQEELRFMVDEALLGTDSALIVSGTSTSGKRHMVIGQPFISSATDGAMSGLAERIVHDVYARDPNEEWTLSVSIYSIFKDIISDLLAPHRNDTSLRLECGKDGYAHVVNLSEVGLTTTADLLMLLRMSIRAREDMETTLSGRDARSTLVLQLKLKNVKSGQRAQIAMLDLGGSEEPQLEGLRSLAVLSPPSPQLDGLLSSPPMSPSFEGEALLGAFKLQQQMHKSPSFEGEASVGAFKLQQLMRKMVEVSTSVVVLCVCSPISESFIGMREGLALAEQSNQLDVKDLENRENRSSSMSSTQSQAAFNGDVAQLRVYR
ncbi:P-loop containing nucleoside triphosphate hydrolase protein [Pavlovales sp. CCMP2436]|nr:P-loop containing nucleoside triphosphate hydrolase protein [Pavlovales sp. CCMP2436]